MRRLCVLLLAGLMLVTGLPAEALGGYSQPQRISSCEAYGDVVAVADTSLWGVLGCDGAMRLVHRTPAGTWTSRPLPYRGFVRAVADDGRTTFVAFVSRYDPSGTTLVIARVPHGGTPSAARVLDSTSEDVPGVSLVARDGRWWAVWDRTFYAGERTSYSAATYQARSIEPALSPRPLRLGAGQTRRPFLALRREGAVLGFTRSQGSSDASRDDVRPGLAVAGRDGTFVERDLGVATPDGADIADVAVSGGRTAIVLRDGPRTLLALDDLSLRFSTRQVVTRAVPQTLSLAMSGGRAFVGHSECFITSAGHPTCRAYVAEGGVTGALSTTEVSAPLGRADPELEVYALGVTAARGLATAVTTVGQGSTWVQSQRAG